MKRNDQERYGPFRSRKCDKTSVTAASPIPIITPVSPKRSFKTGRVIKIRNEMKPAQSLKASAQSE